jgi:hypothetical protein
VNAGASSSTGGAESFLGIWLPSGRCHPVAFKDLLRQSIDFKAVVPPEVVAAAVARSAGWKTAEVLSPRLNKIIWDAMQPTSGRLTEQVHKAPAYKCRRR